MIRRTSESLFPAVRPRRFVLFFLDRFIAALRLRTTTAPRPQTAPETYGERDYEMSSYPATQSSIINGVEITPDLLLSLYEKMLHVYFVEERMKAFVKANKCSFHASTRGHEKLQIAITLATTPGKDWFFRTTGRRPWRSDSGCRSRICSSTCSPGRETRAGTEET